MNRYIIELCGGMLALGIMLTAMYGAAGTFLELPGSEKSMSAAVILVLVMGVFMAADVYVADGPSDEQQTVTGNVVVETDVGAGEAESVDLYGPGTYTVVKVDE